ncbi:MAG: ferredoxin--NADP reductase [Gammaproteobacteria bacterium]
MTTASPDPEKWAQGSVVKLNRWTEKLYSIHVRADNHPFKAGQFTKLGLMLDDQFISRPYSFVNEPDDSTLEFYFVTVPDGPLTSEMIRLAPGDELMVMKRASGFLVLDEVPAAKQLWMLSTGTAIGPFLSILKQKSVWEKFKKVVLVHAVRQQKELSFQEDIDFISKEHKNDFDYIPFVSREQISHCFSGRIPASIKSGALEKRTGLTITTDNSQIMICGNPAMVKETTQVLLDRGLTRNRRKTPGQITVENYW